MCTASPEANRRLILKSMGKRTGERQTFLPLPSSPLSGLKTPLFSMRDKLGILLEPFRARGQKENESIAESGEEGRGRKVCPSPVRFPMLLRMRRRLASDEAVHMRSGKAAKRRGTAA